MRSDHLKFMIEDLCARLPYNPTFHWESSFADGEDEPFDDDLCIVNTCDNLVCGENNDDLHIEDIRLYLRPLTSATKKEMEKYNSFNNDTVGNIMAKKLDYLNSIHIDYRGLIEKGLALEAPDDMYTNIKGI